MERLKTGRGRVSDPLGGKNGVAPMTLQLRVGCTCLTEPCKNLDYGIDLF